MNSENRSEWSPKIHVRLGWWFGIYCSGALPMALAMKDAGVLIGFPWGLVFVAAYLFDRTWLITFPNSIACLAYGFYAIHLFLTITASNVKMFRFLLVILLVVVVVNLIGCASQARVSGGHAAATEAINAGEMPSMTGKTKNEATNAGEMPT